jgi:iron complex outermembrane recepter protein
MFRRNFIFLLVAANTAMAQDRVPPDTTYMLKEVVVSGFQANSPKNTSLNIEPYSLKQINDKSPFNLSDALAKLPGISQMTTGNAISKPVIRGLFGNRILVLFSGLRFDNQQFQDEHGLGLSQIGIDRVEVIKGPASLLYGSDAMGGVINVIEEKPTGQGKKLDFGTQLFSNTLGTLTNIGFSKRLGDKWWRLRAGFEDHADYSDGNNNRVLNSRNAGYYLKAGIGFDKPKWIQENSYNFSYNQFGFITADLDSTFQPDSRWSRSMAGPHHIVILNLFNSQNTFLLKSSVLKLNVGAQSNIRMEDEGGGQISLNMHLTSILQNLKWEKDISKKVTFVCNQQLTFENNTNYGGRILIPDADFLENNLSGYFKFKLNKVILEVGAGGNDKYIKTFPTGVLNTTPGDPIQPFAKNDVTGNGMIGAVYNPVEWFTLKTNAATGSRSPNLAELSSNGVHEGVYRYEIGDPNLKPEQNVNGDLTMEIDRKQWFFSASSFYNRFFNYVYLQGTKELFYGFPVFRYKQQDAKIYGGEFYFAYSPASIQWLQWKEGFTATRGVLDQGGNLPFIPAYKLNSAIRFEKIFNGKVSRLFIEPEFVYTFSQDNPSMDETTTGDYGLLNLSAVVTVRSANGDWNFGLTGTNLTNTAYADHLSRLKYYRILNQGLNFVFSVRKEFKW